MNTLVKRSPVKEKNSHQEKLGSPAYANTFQMDGQALSLGLRLSLSQKNSLKHEGRKSHVERRVPLPPLGSFLRVFLCGGQKPANPPVRENNFGFALWVRRFALGAKRFAPVSKREPAAWMRPGIQGKLSHGSGTLPPVKWDLGDETLPIAGRWAAPGEGARWKT